MVHICSVSLEKCNSESSRWVVCGRWQARCTNLAVQSSADIGFGHVRPRFQRGETMMRTSRNSCGECSVEVEGDPVRNSLCNCDDCRRRTGAPFGWSTYFLNEQIRKVEGPLITRAVDHPTIPHTRYFCPKCGSNLFWKITAGSRSDQTGFAGGCFNDPTMPAPSLVGRYSQRMPWTVFPSACEISQT